MGPQAASSLLPELKRSATTGRAVAAEALGRVRRSTETAAQLVDLLDDESALVRAAAVNGLAQLGTLAQTAQPGLRRLMQDPDANVRARCLGASLH